MSEVRNETSAASKRFLFYGCASLAVLKLLLVSREEIIARFLPHDDLNYMLAAQRWYWFGHGYNYMMYIRQPIYSLWIALAHVTRVPLRIAIELLFLLAAFCLVRAFLRAGLSCYLCTLCFAFIVFHPVSFQLFDWALSDTLYAVVLLLAMAAIIAMWLERNTFRFRRNALLSGIALGLMWNIRPEGVLIVGLLGFLAIIAAFVQWRAGNPTRLVLPRAGAMVMIPGLVILAITTALATANFCKIGLFATSELDAPGFAALCKALLRIKPSKSLHLVPITAEARQLAYAASPTFAQLKPKLENSSAWVYPISARLGAPGQVIAGLTYWFFRDAAAQAGEFQSARQADTLFARAAREINKALRDGRLPSRFVAVNFLDPELSDYLSYVPASFKGAIRLMVSTADPPRDSDTPDLKTQHLYDQMANRRSALLRSALEVRGWVAPASGPLKQIVLRNSEGEILGSTDRFSPRPDVARFLAGRGINPPAEVEFTLNSVHELEKNDTSLIVVTNHEEYQIPLNALNRPVAGVVYHIDSVSFDEVPLQRRIQIRIWRLYGRLVRVFTWLALGGAIFFAVGGFQKRGLPQDLWIILVLLLFAVVTRFSLFVLLDASSWPALQERYFFPVMPIYSCCLLIVIEEALRSAWNWSRSKRERISPPVLVEAHAPEQ